jgi:hypothetical protein
MKKQERMAGMTVVEILLGMMLSLMVLLVSSNLMAAIFYSDTRNKQAEILEQVKNDLLAEFSTQIKWAEEISYSEGRLTMDGVEYVLSEGRIKRNDDLITPQSVVIEDFRIKNYSADEGLSSLEISVGMRHKVISSVHDTLKIVVSQRRMQLGGSDEE